MLCQVFILLSTVKNVIDNWEKFVLLKSSSNLEKTTEVFKVDLIQVTNHRIQKEWFYFLYLIMPPKENITVTINTIVY